MKRKFGKRGFSILFAAAMVLGSFGTPVFAASVEQGSVRSAEMESGREVNFNQEWRFYLGEASGAEMKNFDDSMWENISIPHDFSIDQEYSNTYEAESGFLPGGTGWYRKTFVLPAEYQGKTIVINFDGVYNHAYVYVNGTKLGENHYGYNDFSFDISDYVTCDGSTKNVIAVQVVHNTPSSRWYSGSGIYRDVSLAVMDQIHVAKNGTYVTTPELEKQKDGNVTVKVETKVQNDSGNSVNAVVRTTVLDADRKEVSVPSEKSVTVAPDSVAKSVEEVSVNRPALWSCESPNLYYVKTEISVAGMVKDTYETTFGFRYIRFEPDTGFYLNGKNVKLKGVCMHHDQGALGAAAYRDAIYRQVRILKEMGCNAIRTSHSTPADVLLDACNELGVMVMDETYDGWEFAKNGNTQDFSTHFTETLAEDNQILGGGKEKTWYRFVLESNIERDKNDPSVVMWDIGNELNFGVPSYNNYVQYARDMIVYIQAIDDTRPITSGDNNPSGNASYYPSDFRNQITAALVETGGVAGMNYSMPAISSVHWARPDWPIVATETASPSNSRGIYNTLSQYGKAGDYQCTAYDTNWVSWGNSARESWWYTIKDDFVSGEFIWTGFDYIGEPTPWNGTGAGSTSGDPKAVPNSSYFGVIDTAGFPKDSYYFYTSQWREDTTTLHVVPQSWNEKDLVISGGEVPVYIYSNADKVELYLNGKLVGTSTRNTVTTAAGHEYATYSNESNNTTLCTAVNESYEWQRMAAQFHVRYEEGTLSTRAYDENGKLIEKTIGLNSVTTNSDEGTSLNLKAEKEEIQADGSSLCYISVEIEDANGNFVSAARDNIRFTLTGNGTIVGVDNGNPSTIDKFQQKSVLTGDTSANIDAFSGKALVIVRSTQKNGGFTLRAQASGLAGASIYVDTTGGKETGLYIQEYDITDEYTVEIGSSPELQKEVTGRMNDGTAVRGTVEWETIPEEVFQMPGDYTIYGTMQMGGQTIRVSAVIHVKEIIAAIANDSRATAVNVAPVLPETLPGILPNGRFYDAYPVDWEQVLDGAFSEVGSIVTVKGTAALPGGEQWPVTSTVRVAEGEVLEPENAAPVYKTLTESCSPTADRLESIVDGVNDVLSDANMRWTNYGSYLLNPSASITFTWDEVKKLEYLNLWFFGDSNVSVPAKVNLYLSSDGVNYTEVAYTQTESVVNAKTVFTLQTPQDAVGLRITMTQQSGKCVGLTECEIWTSAYGYSRNSTAVLDSLTINGSPVEGFVSGEYDPEGYRSSVGSVSDVVVQALARDNAAVTTVPVDQEQMLRIIVQSEDQTATNIYEIRLEGGSSPAIAELAKAVSEAENREQIRYSAESWKIFEAALKKAKEVQSDRTATDEERMKVLEELQGAIAGLQPVEEEPGKEKPGEGGEKPPVRPPVQVLPKKGSIHICKNAYYKITKADVSGGTVTFLKPLKKTNSKLTVPSTVKIDGITFMVTEIANNACKANKKLTRVTVGSNVQSIGKSAFAGDPKLKAIVIKSKVLKKIGRGAFRGIHEKCRIKVPKAAWKAYTRLMKGKGQKQGVKIVK